MNSIPLTIIEDSQNDALTNMEQDLALYLEVEKDETKAFLRFYSWDAEYVTYGKNQKQSEVLLMGMLSERHRLIQRPTGGGIVRHKKGDFTYSLVLPRKILRQQGLQDNYYQISGTIKESLSAQGMPVELAKVSLGEYRSRRIEMICQEFPAKYELLMNSRKVMGSAQKLGRKAFLQQTHFFIKPGNVEFFKQQFVERLQRLFIYLS